LFWFSFHSLFGTKLNSTSELFVPAAGGKSEEMVLVHNLQVEVEGTRTAVDKLERRLDSLCGDVKDIGSTLHQILQAMGQQPNAKPFREQKLSELASQAEAQSAGSDKPPVQPVNQVKTYMREAPLRRVVDRQRSAPVLQQGASPLARQTSTSRPQFFFGSSPDKECFNDIFTSACTQGTCGALREEFSPSLSRGYLGGARPSPTLSPLSQGSVNSHTQLLGVEEEAGSPRLSGGGGECKGQYYKLAGSDSEHDLLSTNGHSSSCSPQTPLSPYPRSGPRSPTARFKPPSLRRRGTGPHPGLHRQTSVSLPDPPCFPDPSSDSEESLSKAESLPLEPLAEAQVQEIRAPLSRAESFSDLIQPQDSTEL